ncbi:MAG TPA: hypothetical protein VGA56_08870 [Opitutaceae bacterium]
MTFFRPLLLHGDGGADYRGFFRILTEAHIPFAVTTGMDWLTDGRRDAYDLVVAPDGAPPELDAWVEEGGRLLVAGTDAPSYAATRARVISRPSRPARSRSILPGHIRAPGR